MPDTPADISPHLKRREELIRTGTPGIDSARLLSDVMDEAVRKLSRTASPLIAGRWALIALGGWGAGALLPASDLDLLLLSDEPAARLQAFAEGVLYPLWDSGLKVGHQVRSPRSQRDAMRTDLKTRTAALTARPVAGDEEWAQGCIDDWIADAHKRRNKTTGELLRRPRPGSPYGLQPDLKEGAGGRRDFDELVWFGAVLSGARADGCQRLIELELLGADEASTVESAAEVIARARWELHRAGHRDTMAFEAVEDFEHVGVDEVQEALAETALATSRVRARLGGDAGAGDMNAWVKGAPVSAATVFGALDAGTVSLPDLECLAQAGLLDRFVPGMRTLMSLRRPGLGHQLTVGAHCLTAATLIAGIERSNPEGLTSARYDDVRVAQVAALVHDAGKQTHGPGHAARGTTTARIAAGRLGLSTTQAQTAAALVENHLLLAETAFSKDLNDEDTILRCAARISDPGLLVPLHMLTVADSMATGQTTWTLWTESLIGSLVVRLEAALSQQSVAGLADRAEAARADALAAIDPLAQAESSFITQASLRYLASRTPRRVARDAALAASLSMTPATKLAMAVSPGPAENTHTITFVAPDATALLARLAGAIALAGLDILSVDAYSALDGLALDEFVVAPATGRPASEETFSAVERLANAALRDRLEVATRLAERNRHYPPRASIPVEVRVQDVGWDSVVTVVAADRPGLLHDIASAMSNCGLDIRWARAATIDGVARDTFHVVGSDGGPVDDPGTLGHLAMRIREIA